MHLIIPLSELEQAVRNHLSDTLTIAEETALSIEVDGETARILIGDAPTTPPAPKKQPTQRRKRRTKAEMEAARAAETAKPAEAAQDGAGAVLFDSPGESTPKEEKSAPAANTAASFIEEGVFAADHQKNKPIPLFENA